MATVLAVTVLAALSGCGDDAHRMASVQPAATISVDAAPAKEDLEHVGGALRDVRDAQTMHELQQRFDALTTAASALSSSLADIGARYEATVSAGQLELSMRKQPQSSDLSTDAHLLPTAPVGNLALAMDSLLMCRDAYTKVSGSYRAHLASMTQALGNDLSLTEKRNVDPTIATLLEDQLQLRSILTDVSAKSKAVIAEIDIVSSAP